MRFGFMHEEDRKKAAKWERRFAWLPVYIAPARPGVSSAWVWLDWYWRRYAGDYEGMRDYTYALDDRGRRRELS